MECAKGFARVGAKLIITARSQEKGVGAVKEVSEAVNAAADGDGGKEVEVDVLELDLSSWDLIRRFKEELKGKYEHLDLAILNAGVYCTSFKKSSETGLEETIQVNVLSTLLTSLIALPLLQKSPLPPSRLIIIFSEAHAWSYPRQPTFPLLLKALNEEPQYKPYERYHISKLLIVLWAHELAERLDPAKVLVASASPGFTRSGLFRGLNSKLLARGIEAMVCRTAAQGASMDLMSVVMLGMENSEEGDEGNNGRFWSDGAWRGPTAVAKSEDAVGIRETMWDGLKEVVPDWGKGYFEL